MSRRRISPRLRLALLGVLVLAGLAGCAVAPRAPEPDAGPEAACRAFFTSLDEHTEVAGVRDGIGTPPAEFPYLRATRFLNSFHDALDDATVRGAWLDAAQALDREARLKELRNMGPEHRGRIRVPERADGPVSAVEQCGDRLRAQDRLDAADGPWPTASEALEVPDEYITWHRAVGIYPVSRWFIRSGVAAWQNGVREEFSQGRAAEAPGLRYGPTVDEAHPSTASRLLATAPRDPLGWPLLSSSQWRRVFEAYAPILEVEKAAPYNRIGTPELGEDGLPGVNTDEPTVYTQATGTRFGDVTLVQLNYTWWFTERPLDHWLDLLGGRLDGLTLRLTLTTGGELLLVETMHNCGCYHQHYPLEGLEPKDRPDYAEPPLILPGPEAPEQGQRLHVRLQDGSHYVTHLASAPVTAQGQRYGMVDYDRLRSLPAGDGGHGSLFEADGLVAGTERSERWFLWVSGVPEPGAMRQYYRHATAFVGRRHFDDPDLLERIYRRTE